MAVLHTKVFPASRFSPWTDKEPSCFSSDLAALQEGGPFAPIYDDAADIGFTLVSDRTGDRSVWYVEDMHRDAEGDVTHSTLRATPETIRKYPHLAAYTLTVWND